MLSTHTLAQYTADIEDYPIHYTEAGNGEILLLIHGSLCDYRYWRWQLPALSQQYRVVAPSLRGFWPTALTGRDSAFNIEQHTNDMVAFSRQLGDGQPIHVLGHSRGAQVAMALACAAPDLVRSLVLADPGFRFTYETAGYPFPIENVAALLERGEVEQALAGFIDAVNGAGTWRQMVGWFKTMVTDNAYTLLSQAEEANPGINLEQARQLQCPILLVGGANSPARYGNRIDILANTFEQALRITIPLASHGMNLANPKAFNQEVKDFLAAHAAS